LAGRLEGKVALVTGSTSNIGKGVAIAMAAEGASVVVTGRDAARGAHVVNLIEAAGGMPPSWLPTSTGPPRGRRNSPPMRLQPSDPSPSSSTTPASTLPTAHEAVSVRRAGATGGSSWSTFVRLVVSQLERLGTRDTE